MRQYLVDAFADQPFKGNPACVVEPFDIWPGDDFLKKLAMENNQAETAYLLRSEDPARFGLRWFTPTTEVKLCGHATLASAHVLFNELGHTAEVLTFDTLSGPLCVRRSGKGGLEMDFPAYEPHEIAAMPEVEQALGFKPKTLYGGPALIAFLDSEEMVRDAAPDMTYIQAYPGSVYDDQHLIVTAFADADKPYQVVSRLFAPGMGIPEDPATGSMHCMLAPLYETLTGKSLLDYYQAHPKRGAHMQCERLGDRVKLRGQAVTVARSDLLL